MMKVHPKIRGTQRDVIKIDFSDIAENNNACVWGSNDFQPVTPSNCHTPRESAIRPSQHIPKLLLFGKFFP